MFVKDVLTSVGLIKTNYGLRTPLHMPLCIPSRTTFLHSLPGRFDPLCFTSHSTGSQKGKESLATNYLPALAVRSRSQTTTAALADDKHTLAVDLSSAAYQARTPPLAITPLSPCLG